MFQPTVFQPTVFQPTVFQPTVFQPTVFQPTEFHPVLPQVMGSVPVVSKWLGRVFVFADAVVFVFTAALISRYPAPAFIESYPFHVLLAVDIKRYLT